MTNREFLTAIANSSLSDELTAYAAEQIAKLDMRNAMRREKQSSKPSKTSIENEPIKASIMEFLSAQSEPMIAADIAENVKITTAKASSLLTQLVKSGKVVKSEVKIPKKGKVKAYSISMTDAVEAEDAEVEDAEVEDAE